jgi:hypothetical protein
MVFDVVRSIFTTGYYESWGKRVQGFLGSWFKGSPSLLFASISISSKEGARQKRAVRSRPVREERAANQLRE